MNALDWTVLAVTVAVIWAALLLLAMSLGMAAKDADEDLERALREHKERVRAQLEED